MNSFHKNCLLCLSYNNNTKHILSKDDDGIVLEEKLKFILPEENLTLCYYKIVKNYERHRPKCICKCCLEELNRVYKFKQKCLKNFKYLSDYLEGNIKDNANDASHSINITQEIVETADKQDNNQYEEIVIKIEPEDIQEHISDLEEETNLNSLEEVVVKGEPTDSHDEIETEEDPFDETYSEDTLRDETESSAGNIPPIDKAERLHKCNLCEKSFTRSSHLRAHQLVHSGEKRHQCDVCQKSFRSRYHLATHKLIHTGEKPFECDLCEKAFNQKTNLMNHKRIHTGEKPYECDICGKAFTDSQNLTRHRRAHSGEKPYKCEMCNKAFIYKHGLVHHQRKRVCEEKKYKCEVCSKTFDEISRLEIHKLTHTDERPYDCDLCSYKCASSSGLKSHVQRRHKSGD